MNTASSRHAVVAGCGIGGPVIAMALQRIGIDATIYEAYDRGADFVGSFLNLASNGIDALRAIGADRVVLNSGFPTPRMVMWSGSGKRLGEVANGITLEDGTTSQTIQRGLLHQVLRDAAVARGIRLVPGSRLVGAEHTPTGVRATVDCTSGLQQVNAAMLIGADGLHSTTRRLIDPAAPSPRYTGLLSLGGRAVTRSLEPTPDTFHMVFGKRAFFGYTVRPSGEVFWFANIACDRQPAGSTSNDAATWKARLIALFADDAGPAIELVTATEDDVGAYPIFDMPVVPRWSSGGMVITGDAAHATSPSSGQGASMAIEDAIVLAKCLRDIDDIPRAFAAYERLRRARVERVVRYSERIGRTKSPGPVGRWLRDLFMPVALKAFANPDAQSWLYRHHIDWNQPVATPAGT
jgi:2-polyprenyl-6-methoxyphenol hydroxylase-like FAD-dependent oxidoreductase